MTQILLGAVVAVGTSPLLAALVGVFFRFPVPFAGYQSGPRHLTGFLIGAGFYLVLGGAVLQALLGAFVGAVVYWWTGRHGRDAVGLTVGLAAACALPGVLLLSVLDWFIGDW